MNNIESPATSPPKMLIHVDKFKGKCRKCPHYSLDILDSPKAKMVGRHNVPVLGESSFDIDPSSYQNLLKAFEDADFTNFDTEYLTNFADLASTTITYKSHRVVFHDNPAPEELLVLSKLIDALVLSNN